MDPKNKNKEPLNLLDLDPKVVLNKKNRAKIRKIADKGNMAAVRILYGKNDSKIK